MAIYELTHNTGGSESATLNVLAQTTFAKGEITERGDLQRLLRVQIEAIAPETMVIAEEFGNFEKSQRRIDLLGIDADANLVVIELKRTEDGGHMDLQALRYSAMVSTMTFAQAVDAFNDFLGATGRQDEDAQTLLLEHLDWEAPREHEFAQQVRMILASADFSKELTTAVLWLNDQGLDITCMRIRPFEFHDGVLLLDIHQVIPLPEAADYQERVKEKTQKEQTDRSERHVLRKQFWTALLERALRRTDLHKNISPGIYSWIGTSAHLPSGLSFNYVCNQDNGRAELYINNRSQSENTRIFEALEAEQDAIAEKILTSCGGIEKPFGGELDWDPMAGKQAARIAAHIDTGGYRSDRGEWPDIQDAMIDAMIRLNQALRPHIEALTTKP